MNMKISYRYLLSFIVTPLLCAEDSVVPQHLPCVKLSDSADAEHALCAAEDFNRDAVADYLRARGVEMPSLSESELVELSQRTPTGETELMRAVAAGDTERVAFILIYAPQLVNLQNAYGYTALMQAESAEMVNLLLAFGADGGMKNDLGCTALDVACQAGRAGVVGALVAAKAPIGLPYSVLRYACAEGDVAFARRVLSEGGVDVNARVDGEASLLALAVKAQSEEQVQLLLEHGAKPKGSGALRVAVQTDQPHLVRLFMEHEHLCPPSSRNPRQGVSVQDKLNALLHAACRYNAPKTVKMVLEMGADANDTRMTSYGHFATGNTPLHDAARNSVEILKLLLAGGADINALNAKGDTPLMLSLAFTGAEPVSIPEENALFLLDSGADASIQNNAGENAADIAWYAPHKQALARAGVQKTPFEHPLADAVSNEDVHKVRRLLAAGAEPDKPLRSGSTLLQVLSAESIHDDAVENEIFRLLVQAGARLDDDVFLHLCGWGSATMLQAMLEAGFPIQPSGIATYEYLHKALHGHQPHCALPLLLQAGADINVEDERGYTLLIDLAMSDYFIDRNLTELLKHQPNLEATIQGSTAEWNGLTALGVCVKKGNLAMAYQLLLAGAKATPQQLQAIFFHVLREHPEQAEMMLTRYGASPTAPEPATGLSPIELAHRSGNEALVSLLMAATCNP